MIIVDVETTGMDPETTSLVAIGAVDFSNPTNTFYVECQIWEGAQILDAALAINGFSREQITNKTKPTQKEALEQFLSWLEQVEDITVAGINPFFDVGFLRSSLKREGLPSPFGMRIVDLHTLVYVSMKQRGVEIPLQKNRSNLHTDIHHPYVGLPLEPKPHKAINGACWEAEAFSRIIFGKNLLEKFKEHPIPTYLLK